MTPVVLDERPTGETQVKVQLQGKPLSFACQAILPVTEHFFLFLHYIKDVCPFQLAKSFIAAGPERA
jgi:hypothetical protein